MEKAERTFSVLRREEKNTSLPTRLPHAVELEETVLGALLIERNALTDVVDILQPTSFYREANQHIYSAIVVLFNDAQPVDPRTVVNQLRKQGLLEQVGGAPYIASLTESVASKAHIEHHARIIVEQAMRRGLIIAATAIKEDAQDPTQDTFDLLDRSEQALFEISETNIRKNYEQVDRLMSLAIKELEAKRDNKEGITGIPTGLAALDRLISGWQKSDFVVIAARPGMGKTAFMLSLLRNAAIDYHAPVAFFSLEMSSVQLMNRLLSSESGLDSEKIRTANLKEYEWEQLFHKTAQLAKAPIYIDDTPALSLFEFRAKCRRLKAQRDVRVIFVDYLQLMVDDKAGRHNGNREQQVAAISRGIKAVAKELDITIIVASQLSRSVETRGGDKRPMLQDLRESGSIEQDADQVMFLYRPEYYGLTEDEEGNDTRQLAEVILAKHRNGPVGKVTARYHAYIMKFSNPGNDEDFWESKIFDVPEGENDAPT